MILSDYSRQCNVTTSGLVSGDCPVENYYLCPDQRTYCDLGDSCCPDPEANTGLGCCNAGKNVRHHFKKERIVNVDFRLSAVMVSVAGRVLSATTEAAPSGMTS